MKEATDSAVRGRSIHAIETEKMLIARFLFFVFELVVGLSNEPGFELQNFSLTAGRSAIECRLVSFSL